MPPPAIPITEIAAGFGLPAAGAHWEPLGNGRIHHTFLAHYPGLGSSARRVHQRLNLTVFRYPEEVMENLGRVSRHLEAALPEMPPEERRRRVLTLVVAADGRPWFVDSRGEWWRTFHYVEDGVAHERPPGPAWVEAAARAFARFSLALDDLPPPPLKTTLPGFHDTPRRLVALEQALLRDPMGRAGDAAELAAVLLARRELAALIPRALAAGRLPLRTCHNDTKLNNVLFHGPHPEVLCVVDLDTVMPGTVLHDFGDLVRSTIAGADEDDTATAPLALQMEHFAAAVAGYMDARRGWLDATELALMAHGPAAITLELAARFLTDHVTGDGYFPAPQAGDNLRRARRQYRLLQALETHHRDLVAVVEREARS
ncbi:MAG: phosphotransferase [Gammaproteobacteria bacterium]|nr:phosphotransferase [Gammaproteobacteria bacterium]